MSEFTMNLRAGCTTVILAIGMAQADAADDARPALDALFADERSFTWREDPLTATYDGVHDYDDRLPSVTPEDQARRLAADRAFIERLRGIDNRAHQSHLSRRRLWTVGGGRSAGGWLTAGL